MNTIYDRIRERTTDETRQKVNDEIAELSQRMEAYKKEVADGRVAIRGRYPALFISKRNFNLAHPDMGYFLAEVAEFEHGLKLKYGISSITDGLST